MELNYFWVGVANIQRIGLEKRYLHEIPACAMHLPPSSPVFLFFSYFCIFFCVLLETYSHSSSDCRSNLSVSLSDLTGSE